MTQATAPHLPIQMQRILSMCCTCFVAILLAAVPTTAHAETPEYLKTMELGVDTELFPNSIAIDSNAASVIVGSFSGTATFGADTPQETQITSAGNYDVFIAKFLSDGTLSWVVNIGDTGADQAHQVAIDQNNDIFVSGEFWGEVYFDPEEIGGDPKDVVSQQTSNGGSDSFLLKYSSAGIFEWVRTWGNADSNSALALTIDSGGDPVVSGTFNGTVQFDPEGGTANLSGVNATHLSKFRNAGGHMWTKVFTDGVYPYNLAIDSDDNSYLVGQFTGPVDFNPGFIPFEVSAVGEVDAFILKHSPNGEFLARAVWGGALVDIARAVAIDANDQVYVGGTFGDTVDLDPGHGEQNETALSVNSFLTAFTSDLDYQWHQAWGADDQTTIVSLTTSQSTPAQVYGIGWFQSSVQFNPGSTDSDSPVGYDDIFAISFTALGEYTWHTTWGGLGSDVATDIAYGPPDTLNLLGYFEQEVDFDFTVRSDPRIAMGDLDGYVTTYYLNQSSASADSTSSTTTSQALSAPSTPGCIDVSPVGIPDLFQVARTGPEATLFFTPVKNNASSYYISYGDEAATEGYGVSFPYSDTSGVIQYTVSALDPTKTYSFKVRAGNGCATGLWSQTIQVGPARTQLAATNSEAAKSLFAGFLLLGSCSAIWLGLRQQNHA